MNTLRFEKFKIKGANFGEMSCLPDIKNDDYIRATLTVLPEVTSEESKHMGKGMIPTLLPYRIQSGYDRSREDLEFDAAILDEVLRQEPNMKVVLEDSINKNNEFGQDVAFRYRKGTEVTDVTFEQFYLDTKYIGSAYTEMGFKKGNKIAMIGPNSYEWITVFVSVLNSEAVFVPVDKELPIEEIAFNCGFISAEHFSVRFRKEYGTTPTNYRKLNSIV